MVGIAELFIAPCRGAVVGTWAVISNCIYLQRYNRSIGGENSFSFTILAYKARYSCDQRRSLLKVKIGIFQLASWCMLTSPALGLAMLKPGISSLDFKGSMVQPVLLLKVSASHNGPILLRCIVTMCWWFAMRRPDPPTHPSGII